MTVDSTFDKRHFNCRNSSIYFLATTQHQQHMVACRCRTPGLSQRNKLIWLHIEFVGVVRTCTVHARQVQNPHRKSITIHNLGIHVNQSNRHKLQ